MNTKDRDLLFQLAGHITLLRIDCFMNEDEWEVLVKLIRKELESMERNTIDNTTSNKL